jgi:hypothetical protein
LSALQPVGDDLFSIRFKLRRRAGLVTLAIS